MASTIDSANIFREAANYEFSARLLIDLANRRVDDVRAMMANGQTVGTVRVPTAFPGSALFALSLELYFKSISQQDTGSFIKEHSLTKLFASLSVAVQLRINSRFEQIRGNDPYWIRLKAQFPTEVEYLQLGFVLKEARNMFVEFRYVFEGIKDTNLQGFPWAVSAAREAILETNPAWNDLIEPNLRTPPTSPPH